MKVVRTGDSLDGRLVTDIGFQGVTSPGIQALDSSCRVAYLTELDGSSTVVWVTNACDLPLRSARVVTRRRMPQNPHAFRPLASLENHCCHVML